MLLQNTGFISINQIAEILDVSRSTVINDMNDVKKELKHSELHLESRSHYGIRVSGNEKNIRQMLSRISRKVIENQNVHLEFLNLLRS
ncbi:MAG: HTH domain-containing protein [Coprobacillus cateniformis]